MGETACFRWWQVRRAAGDEEAGEVRRRKGDAYGCLFQALLESLKGTRALRLQMPMLFPLPPSFPPSLCGLFLLLLLLHFLLLSSGKGGKRRSPSSHSNRGKKWVMESEDPGGSPLSEGPKMLLKTRPCRSIWHLLASPASLLPLQPTVGCLEGCFFQDTVRTWRHLMQHCYFQSEHAH